MGAQVGRRDDQVVFLAPVCHGAVPFYLQPSNALGLDASATAAPRFRCRPRAVQLSESEAAPSAQAAAPAAPAGESYRPASPPADLVRPLHTPCTTHAMTLQLKPWFAAQNIRPPARSAHIRRHCLPSCCTPSYMPLHYSRKLVCLLFAAGPGQPEARGHANGSLGHSSLSVQHKPTLPCRLSAAHPGPPNPAHPGTCCTQPLTTTHRCKPAPPPHTH